MNGSISRPALFCLALLLAPVGACGGIEVGADYPAADGDYPPDSYVATTEPFYYGGRAAYLYNGRWSYREGGRWNHYGREPAALAQRRAQGAPARRTYEPSRSSGRVSGGRGGGRR